MSDQVGVGGNPTPGCRAFADRLDTLEAGIVPEEFAVWPAGVPLQIHIMENDPLASPPETDLETARHLDATLEEATFHAYPGDRHLFADDSLPEYDPEAASLAERRVLELLG